VNARAASRYRKHRINILAIAAVRRCDPEFLKQQAKAQAKARSRYPEKARARRLVRNAVLAGWMTKKPCAICDDANSEAHHVDYSKPYEVEWLCEFHHRAAHKRNVLT